MALMMLVTPRERAPSIYWIGGWEGARAGLDAVVKIKIPSPCRDSNPNHPIRTYQNCNHEVKISLNLTNPCYHSIQSFVFLSPP